MTHINYEIKAKISEEHQDRIRKILKTDRAEFLGNYHQIDTYLNVEKGKQKIRKSYLEDVLVENELIEYKRKTKKGPELSKPTIYNLNKHSYLEGIRKSMHGVLIEVDKQREIYFIENIKFYIDKITDLGTFVEIKAQSELDEEENPKIHPNKLKEQCEHYKNLFKIENDQLIASSYSDMLLKKRKQNAKH